jgi:hypothetical protein
MTRLTYKKINEHLLVSSEILCGKEFVKIFLYLKPLVYTIGTEGKVLKAGNANTLVSLKRKAKSAVKDLGASFYEEVRNRGSTERYG